MRTLAETIAHRPDHFLSYDNIRFYADVCCDYQGVQAELHDLCCNGTVVHARKNDFAGVQMTAEVAQQVIAAEGKVIR